jgi:DNA-binding ferritin-like protein
MAMTTDPGAHLPALSSHEREEVGMHLQSTLVQLVDLALLGKQLYWSVVGAHFRALHLQLDELIESWRDLSDTVAERAVAIGFWPDGQTGASFSLRIMSRYWQSFAMAVASRPAAATQARAATQP